MSKIQLGNLGETTLMTSLRLAGLIVSRSRYNYGDLIVNGRYIEVKTIRPNARGTHQACLQKKDKYGQTTCANTDYVIIIRVNALECVDGVYIIPTSVLAGKKSITIGKNKSQYDKYRVINYVETMKGLLLS